MVGHVFAVMSKEMKNVLAYSSVANIGCIILVVSTTCPGLAAAIVYVVHYSVEKSALFYGIGRDVLSFWFGKDDTNRW